MRPLPLRRRPGPVRDQFIVEARASGWTYAEIGRAVGVSTGRAGQIAQRVEYNARRDRRSARRSYEVRYGAVVREFPLTELARTLASFLLVLEAICDDTW